MGTKLVVKTKQVTMLVIRIVRLEARRSQQLSQGRRDLVLETRDKSHFQRYEYLFDNYIDVGFWG